MEGLLRIVACGSVDDGKSTVIGRLLAATGSVPADQLEEARRERRPGTVIPPGEVDYSLLTDGLAAERSQGITIDVAYRHLALDDGRRALLADAPGHEQYTSNMVVAASTASLALLVVDAGRGCRPQTWTHLTVCALMGVPDVIVAVNKMDRVGSSQAVFDDVSRQIAQAAQRLGLSRLVFVPLSALTGDGISSHGSSMAWYAGPSLLTALRDWRPAESPAGRPEDLRLPVQVVLRPGDGRRVLAGTVTSGAVMVGQSLRTGRTSRSLTVREITSPRGTVDLAGTGTPVTVALAEDADVDRGDVLLAANSPATAADRWSVDVVWFGDEPLLRGRSYLLRCGPVAVTATVTAVRSRRDVTTGASTATRDLSAGQTGRIELATDAPVLLDPYEQARETGGLLLVDRLTQDTVGAGLVRFPLRRGTSIVPHAFQVDRAARETLLGQRGRVLWLTGLPASGKSTVADALVRRLHGMAVKTVVLDGDDLRLGLNADLGFTPEDRAENVRRVASVARLMLDAGLVVVVALVSPYRADRLRAREIVGPGDFREVWVDTAPEVCVARDPKGLYARAAAGQLPHMTGAGQAYEPPEDPDLVLDGRADPQESAERLLALLDVPD